MLTARGWWMLQVALVLLAFAVLGLTVTSVLEASGAGRYPNVSLGIVAFTVGLWFAFEWALFVVRAGILSRRLEIVREIHDERGPIELVWARRTFQVHALLRLPKGLRLPFVRILDQLPFGAELCSGHCTFEGAIEVAHPVQLNYRLRCTEIGRIRFEGMQVQMADLHGFFYHEVFVPSVIIYRVLPPLADAEGHSPTVKRRNLLPPPGVHRLRTPGSGSELLDLRDYLPGDPPKMIAWKASARRDRLITKEFDSEVPIRCTLFVDTSNSVRLGVPGKNAITRLVETAACVAQASAAERDLTGLCLFDERKTTYVRPARGAHHLVTLINLLTDAAGLAPTSGQAPVAMLLPPAYKLARTVYPDLIQAEVNYVPFWMPWLAPQPTSTMRDPGPSDYVYEWLPVLMLAFAWLALSMVWLIPLLLEAILRPPMSDTESSVSLVVVFIALIATVWGFYKLPQYFFPARRRHSIWRKKLSALLSVRYGLAPDGLARMLEDDEYFVLSLQRFLAEHHVPYSLPACDREGRPQFASPEKVSVLAGALLRAVSKGHDNELFVLLVDLLEVTDQLEPLIRAVKVTIARHHRVLVICPWPPFLLSALAADSAELHGVDQPDRKALEEQYEKAFQQVRRTFARFGVPVISAHTGEPVRIILNRLEQLRMLGRQR